MNTLLSRVLTRGCDRYRTQDILNGPYEKLPGSFPFWDPNLFADEDGRVYFYWGSSNSTPIWGVELDPATMLPLGKPKALIESRPGEIGYERVGEDNSIPPIFGQELEQEYQTFLAGRGMCDEQIPADMKPMIRGMLSHAPFIEGAWMDKHNGIYYLQYACPGAEYNVYSDGVYISEHPLGPFVLAENNPYSYHPGGFMPGAGHGSTMQDRQNRWWHTSTMRISVNHPLSAASVCGRQALTKTANCFAISDTAIGPWLSVRPLTIPGRSRNGCCSALVNPPRHLLKPRAMRLAARPKKTCRPGGARRAIAVTSG